MAHRVYAFTITAPALTAVTAPVMQSCNFPDGTMDQITVQIPNGHCGLTGLQIESGGEQLVPLALGTWFVGDNLVEAFPFTDAPNNGNWNLVAYNTDVYPHTFYVRFYVSENTPAPTSSAPAAPLPVIGGVLV